MILTRFLFINEDDCKPDSKSGGLHFLRLESTVSTVADGNNLFNRHSQKAVLKGELEFDRVGHPFTHKKTALYFRLCTAPHFLPEVQRSLLLQYYCQFDPRVKPLLGVAHFWAVINCIRIGEADISSRNSYCHVPDPAALEWFVVLFICERGLIPTPRQVQDQPHRPIFLKTGTDMGFSEDLKFAQKWATKWPPPQNPEGIDKAIWNLLELAGEFFSFVFSIAMKCKTHPRVINTRDAEILRKGCIQKPKFITKLLPEELTELRHELNIFHYKSRNIVMMHPFNLKWRFSIDCDHFMKAVAPMMRTTGAKLQCLVKKYQQDARQTGQFPEVQSINLKEVLKC